jgi:prepilin-type N-terminal cleavage/methylation domain-containing protein
MHKFSPSSRGFTLIEMMIVISIIITLVMLVGYPYTYYMERGYVERVGDSIAQNWILAHKDIRNGKLFDTTKNANMLLIFEKDKNVIEQYLFSGSIIPDLANPLSDIANVKFDKKYQFDSSIILLEFSGSLASIPSGKVGYIITAPYATGAFYTGSNIPVNMTGAIITIGYPGATV